MSPRPTPAEPGSATPDEVRAAIAGEGPADSIAVIETHISWVFLAGDRAYKLKKPLTLPFVDYGTPSRRRRMCVREVELNRRLAPRVYLGVRSLVRDGPRLALAEPDDQRAIDYLVEMRRFDERQTLAAQLADGRLANAELESVGRTIARFHGTAAPVRAPWELLDARVRREFGANLAELLELVGEPRRRRRLIALSRSVHALLEAWSPELERRALRGAVRRCHGDLRAEHVVLDDADAPAIVDCVEFDDALAAIDVADDLSFLVMDLTARGAAQAAAVLVRAYRDAGGDPGDDGLIALFATHRALVRAKVALIRAGELRAVDGAATAALADADGLIAVAERFAWRARLPLAIVVCGAPASGKSHLAHALAGASGLASVSSDEVRKALLGIGVTDRAPLDAYAASTDAATYADLGRRARLELDRAGGVLVDATFRHRADRDAFRDEFAHAASLLFVECRVPAAVAAERARERERAGPHASDADEAIARREHGVWDPLDEVAAADHLIVRTDRPSAETLTQLVAALDARLLAGAASTG